MNGLSERKFFADVFRPKLVPYLGFRFLVRLVKFVLINEGLVSSPTEFPVWLNYSLMIWKAYREGGI